MTPLDWLKSHLPKINGLPVLELDEINDSDIGFEDAQKITKGELWDDDSVDGEYDEDTDEIEEIDFQTAKTLFVIRRNSEGANRHKPNFIFSSTDEDETEEKYIELAKKELEIKNLEEFRKLFPNY